MLFNRRNQFNQAQVFEDICLVYLTIGADAGIQMKYLKMLAIVNIFDYNVDIIGINMYQYPSDTFIVVVVLFHPCFPELSLTKLIKTGCRIASGKRVEIR